MGSLCKSLLKYMLACPLAQRMVHLDNPVFLKRSSNGPFNILNYFVWVLSTLTFPLKRYKNMRMIRSFDFVFVFQKREREGWREELSWKDQSICPLQIKLLNKSLSIFSKVEV